MLSKTQIRKKLCKVLNRIDPPLETEVFQRARINYPMKNFRYALADCCNEFPDVELEKFVFPEENIKKELTTCWLKSQTRRAKLTYDYKTETVEGFCVGKDCDGFSKKVPVNEISNLLRELFPRKKRVIVVRKKK